MATTKTMPAEVARYGIRWRFTEITPESFHWIGEALEPDGKRLSKFSCRTPGDQMRNEPENLLM